MGLQWPGYSRTIESGTLGLRSLPWAISLSRNSPCKWGLRWRALHSCMLTVKNFDGTLRYIHVYNFINVRNWTCMFAFVQLRCANCGEETKWVCVTQMVSVLACGCWSIIHCIWCGAYMQEKVPVKGGRGAVNLLVKCKMCSRENSVGQWSCSLLWLLTLNDYDIVLCPYFSP